MRASLLSLGDNPSLRKTAAAIIGGAGGAMLGGFLVRQGVKPSTAAVGVTVAGGVAAMTLQGASRLAAGGAAAAGAGQLALAWMATQNEGAGKVESLPAASIQAPPKLAAVPASAPPSKRQGRPSIEASFDRARKHVGARNQNVRVVQEVDDDDLDDFGDFAR